MGIKYSFIDSTVYGTDDINDSLAAQVEEAVKNIKKPIKVAVMGCVVNGPGEAREADIGIAGGDGCAVLFKKGEILRKVSEEDIVKELLDEIDKI